MSNAPDGGADRKRLAAMVAELNTLEAAGAAKASHPDHARRDELWEELQQMVGLGGKMVMERDIMRRASQLLAGV